nr:putative reverse transcriptase domain-containing protein [Tanacetum cinerariifolium]
MMNWVCKPYLDKFIIVFIDDILIYLKSKEEHEDSLPSEKGECEASKVENTIAEMLRGLDQLMERKEDGVDRLTKLAHFLAIREDYKMEKLVRLFIDEIVAGHGVPASIISDRDGRFTLGLLANITESLRDAFGYECGSSSLDGWTNWDVHLPLAEFSYNNSYHSSIRCALFEALYGRKCRSPVLWVGIRESRLSGPGLVQDMIDKVVLIKEKLKAARDRQKSYVDNRCKPLEFKVRDQVLLKVSPLKCVIVLKRKEPVEIMDREIKSLKRSKISIVKVRWNSKRDPEIHVEIENLILFFFKHIPKLQFDFPYSASLGNDPGSKGKVMHPLFSCSSSQAKEWRISGFCCCCSRDQEKGGE